MQRSVKKGRFKSAGIDDNQDTYVIYDFIDEIAKSLLGRYADAQEGHNDTWENACIYAGNKSAYPQSMGGDEQRVPFECIPTTCAYGRTIGGIKCNYGYSGLVNKADMGCLPTSSINPAYASKACWERRESLLGRKLIRENPATGEFERVNQVTNPQRQQAIDKEVRDLIAETNEFFGFNVGGIFYSDGFQSEKAKDLINRLVNLGYHDGAYAQLIKVAYFYKSNGQDFPEGTQSMDEGGDTSLSKIGSLKAIERNFNNLNAAVDEIFFALRYHCGKVPGPPNDRVLDRF